jgi:tetratricopeptide (TPR) repeat protein
MMKNLFILLVSLLVCFISYSYEVFGPENLSQSGANIINLESPVLSYYNPSGLVNFRYPMLSIESAREFKLNSIGLSIPIPKIYSTLGLSGFNFADDFFINTIALSYRLKRNIMLGLSNNVISTNEDNILDEYEISFGIGLLYLSKVYKRTNINKFGLGINILNLNKPKLDSVSFPIIADIGILYNFTRLNLNLFFKVKYIEYDKLYPFLSFEKNFINLKGFKLFVGGGEHIISSGLSYNFKDYNFSLGMAKVLDETNTKIGIKIRYGASDEVFAQKHLDAGKKFLEEGNYKDALKEFNIVLSKVPSHYDAIEYINIVNERMKHENKSNIYKYLLLAQEQFNKGDYTNAIKNWEDALELMQQKDEKIIMKIESARKLSEIKDKKKEITKITTRIDELKSKKLETLYNDAMEQYNNNNLYEAFTIFKNIYNVNPNYKDTARKIEQIVDEINKMLKNYISEGDNLYKQKKYSEASERYNMAYYLSKENAEIKKKLIDCYLKSGENFYRNSEYLKAISEWEKILEIDPENKLATEYINTATKKIKQ